MRGYGSASGAVAVSTRPRSGSASSVSADTGESKSRARSLLVLFPEIPGNPGDNSILDQFHNASLIYSHSAIDQ